MKRVFIAGPFTADTGHGVYLNVLNAERYILPLAEAGACPVCPHTMTRNFDGTMTWKRWMAVTLCMLEACDAVLMVPGYQSSAGAMREYDRAVELRLPVFIVNPAMPGRLP